MTDYVKFTNDVITKNAGGKLLFQPRILCWYSDKKFRGESLGEFDGLTLAQIYREMDLCNRIYDYNACMERRISDKRIRHATREISAWEREFSISTPVGDITMRLRKNDSNGGEYYSKWWVENEDDLKVYTYYEQASDWQFLPDVFAQVQDEWGISGAPSVFLPRTSIFHAYYDTMGVENATYALADEPELVEQYFSALHGSHDRYIAALSSSPIRFVNFGDNVHCGLLNDRLVEKYMLPEYVHRCELLHRVGAFICAHWDGDTKSILKYARQTGLDGIEAITPKPQGDVTLEEVKDALGDMFLIDGIAALLFAQPYTEQELVDQTEQAIKLFAPNLIVGISDELASFGDINRVRLVKRIIDGYNAEKERTSD